MQKAKDHNLKLTAKQEKFCQEYVIDLNATQAAIRAGYSEATAKEIASQNLTKPEILQFVAILKEESSKILEITHQDVLKQLKTWAESDITETIGLTPEEVKELPIEVRRLVTSYKHKIRHIPTKPPTKEEYIELHFVSKEKALEMINKHIGFYEKDNKQKAIDLSTLPDDILQQLIQNNSATDS